MTKAPAFAPGTGGWWRRTIRKPGGAYPILQKLGLDVHVAVNGLIAVELVRELRPDFVDDGHAMPVWTGPRRSARCVPTGRSAAAGDLLSATS